MFESYQPTQWHGLAPSYMLPAQDLGYEASYPVAQWGSDLGVAQLVDGSISRDIYQGQQGKQAQQIQLSQRQPCKWWRTCCNWLGGKLLYSTQERQLLKYLIRMMQDHEWGQDIEVEALGQALMRTIVIYGYQGEPEQSDGIMRLTQLSRHGPRGAMATSGTIALLWHRCHYSYLALSAAEALERVRIAPEQCIDVPADGSCLFHAVRLGLGTSEERQTSRELRLLACRWLYVHARSHVPIGETCTLFEKIKSS